MTAILYGEGTGVGDGVGVGGLGDGVGSGGKGDIETPIAILVGFTVGDGTGVGVDAPAPAPIMPVAERTTYPETSMTPATTTKTAVNITMNLMSYSLPEDSFGSRRITYVR